MKPPAVQRHPVLRARQDRPRSMLANMLTATEVAHILGIDPRTVSWRVQRGKLTAHRVDGYLAFNASDIH